MVRLIDDEQRNAPVKALHERFEPFLRKRLHGRNDDVRIVRCFAFGLLDADLQTGILDGHFLDGLLDQLIAMRNDEGDVARPQRQQFGKRC